MLLQTFRLLGFQAFESRHKSSGERDEDQVFRLGVYELSYA